MQANLKCWIPQYKGKEKNRESYGLSVMDDATTPTWFDKNKLLLD